jgi:long-chain acyl-CoA synthetase
LKNIEEHFQYLEKEKLGSKKIFEGLRSMTFNEAIERSRKIGALLHQNGLRSGDTVGVASADECEVSCMILGCLRAGYPLLVLDPGARKTEVEEAMNRSKIQAAFLDQDLIERWSVTNEFKPAISRLWPIAIQKKKLISRLLGKKDSAQTLISTYPECLSNVAIEQQGSQGNENSFVLLTTSGTTAAPKILKLGFNNLESAARTQSKQLGFNQNTRLLNLLPITHYDGIMSGLMTSFLNVFTMIRLGQFSVPQLPDVFDAIYKYRVTHLQVAPSILALMLRLSEEITETFNSEDLQFVISTAAMLPPKLWADFEKKSGKRVVNVYGLSETGNYIFAGPDDESHEIGSIGKPVDCKALIVDERKQEVPVATIGEMLLSGESVIDAYLDQPAPKSMMNGAQYFETGDLGYVDAKGIYWITGRKKNVIIVGGRNVYPDEIDNALLLHQQVAETATIGIPDEIWGDRVVSCVVSKGSVSSKELIEHASKHLTDYKVPRELYFVPELPKGRSGKVLRNELIDLIQTEHLPKASEQQNHLDQELLSLAAQSFRVPREELSLDSSPQNCSGWDSVAHMDFVVGIETKYGLDLLPKEIIQITSIGAALQIIQKKLSA